MISCGAMLPVGGVPRAAPPFTVRIDYFATEEPYAYWPVNPGHPTAVGVGSPETTTGSFTGLKTQLGTVIVVLGYPGTNSTVGIYIPIASMPGGLDIGGSAIPGILINDDYFAIQTTGVDSAYGTSCRYWYTNSSPVIPAEPLYQRSYPFKLELKYRAT